MDYSDATPDVAYGYDRRGRQTTVTQSGGTTLTRLLDDAGQLRSESCTGGPLDGLTVTNTYDPFQRRTHLTLRRAGTPLLQHAYTYANGRLHTVSDGPHAATYSYVANSPLVEQIQLTANGQTVMTTTRSYDNLNRLTGIASVPAAAAPVSFAYAYNAASQRTALTNADASRWAYQYDALGQVTSGRKYWSDGTPVAGQQFEYAFDDIGNRRSATRDGRAAGYTANLLNQYTQRTVPGFVNVLGEATNTATVSVLTEAGVFPTTRHGDYWRAEVAVSNAVPLWLAITNLAVLNQGTNADLIATNLGHLFVPATSETFAHDLDGNLTNDGRFTYTWDAENRITSFTRIASAPDAAKVKLDCAYDPQWRRTQKVVSTWNGSACVPQSTNRFVYDGWNLLAILDHTNGLVQSFNWGTDLSGTMQGAGGVGGLLSMTVHQGSAAGTYFYAYDGNGNVAALVDPNGAVVAEYEYGPFHELVRATGPLAFVNPFLAATKFHDWETGLYYYGYRYYDPDTGRWPSRDPIGEEDGPNIYAFLRNDGINKIDFLGLEWIIEREGKPRAEAWATSASDTFDGLARKIRLDTSDYKKWAQTSDDKPDPCKKYSIPNTIHIDFGVFKTVDQIPILAVIQVWRSMAMKDKVAWEEKGYYVPVSEGVIDSEITSHLGSPNTYGYLFIGHGGPSAVINSYSHLGEDMSGTGPDRYTSHGIAFLTLKACYSADKVGAAGRKYKYNAWESNVSTRGWFVGYTGSVITWNELFLWAIASGKNDGGYSGK